MQREEKSRKTFFEMRNPISTFHMEIDKVGAVTCLLCSGVKGISEFNDEFIKVRGSGFSVLVCGKGLKINIFEGTTVEVIGKISEVKFLYA
jgi:hypothetical protein